MYAASACAFSTSALHPTVAPDRRFETKRIADAAPADPAATMTVWLDVIGLQEGGLEALPPAHRALVESAEVLVGGARHLGHVPDGGQERRAWPVPFSGAAEMVAGLRPRRTVVLASGDPLWHGVAKTLLEVVPAREMAIHPAPSSFQLAAARLGWAVEDVAMLSLHAAPAGTLNAHIHPGARLLLLVKDGGTAGEVARIVSGAGFGESRLVVLSHLGGEAESVATTADAFAGETPPLSVLALEIAGDGRWLARVPGLPDEAFEHDGKMTKRDLRSSALSRLAPHRGALLWDVGAGCGSVSVEWARAGGRALAIEPVAARRAIAARNAAALGVPEIEVIDGRAPEALTGLPIPDAIFLGGGAHEEGVSEACLAALAAGGRLVAHAVTLETEAVLLRHHAMRGGELTRHAVARAEPVGPFSGWHPAMPVTQWAWVKT